MKQVRIACFGVFRDFSQAGFLDVKLADNLTVKEIKQAILAAIREVDRNFTGGELLLNYSALGTNERIFYDEEVIPSAALDGLSLLPPVSGG